MPNTITVGLTAGNLRNGHIYWRPARALLPDDAIGGAKYEESRPEKSDCLL